MILINTMEPWCAIPVHIPISSLNGLTGKIRVLAGIGEFLAGGGGWEGERGEREVFVFLTSKLFPKVVSYFRSYVNRKYPTRIWSCYVTTVLFF